MSIEVALRVDEQGQLQIPAEIQQHLFPGMVVVLTLEEPSQPEQGTNGRAAAKAVPLGNATEDDEPEMVNKDGWTVVRGKLPNDFDWASFLQEGRENRLDSLLEWSGQ